MNKKYYWLKLRKDFVESEAFEFILQQENGSDYFTIYQLLCIKTINKKGLLANVINEVIIPYDIKKITQELKYFKIDTVGNALELFKRLELVLEDDNGVLYISNYEELIGSEVSSAKRVREYRERQKQLQCNKQSNIDVTQEYRDKSIEYRDKDIILTNNTIYDFLEKNFNRTISPLEYEKIKNWIKDFNEEIVKYSIEVAVMANVKTFKYIEGILKNWKSKGYKSLLDIKQSETPIERESQENIFDYDWLNDVENKKEKGETNENIS